MRVECNGRHPDRGRLSEAVGAQGLSAMWTPVCGDVGGALSLGSWCPIFSGRKVWAGYETSGATGTSRSHQGSTCQPRQFRGHATRETLALIRFHS